MNRKQTFWHLFITTVRECCLHFFSTIVKIWVIIKPQAQRESPYSPVLRHLLTLECVGVLCPVTKSTVISCQNRQTISGWRAVKAEWHRVAPHITRKHSTVDDLTLDCPGSVELSITNQWFLTTIMFQINELMWQKTKYGKYVFLWTRFFHNLANQNLFFISQLLNVLKITIFTNILGYQHKSKRIFFALFSLAVKLYALFCHDHDPWDHTVDIHILIYSITTFSLGKIRYSEFICYFNLW